jgi:hypothetical protein
MDRHDRYSEQLRSAAVQQAAPVLDADSRPYTPAPDPSDLGIRRPVIILLAPSQAGRSKIDSSSPPSSVCKINY